MHVLAYAPCGFGKTYTFSDIAKTAVDNGKKVLILTHRLILLRQNAESLSEYGLDDFIVINDENKDMDFSGMAYISSSQTLQSRIKSPEYIDFASSFDLILIDECHLSYFDYFFELGIWDNKNVIGFTGSPQRMYNQRQLGLDYEEIVYSVDVQDLVDMGKLVPCRYFTVPMDISEIKKNNIDGDFQAKSAYNAFDNPEKYSGLVKNYRKYGENRQFLCFCCSIAHTIKTCIELNKAGIKSKFTASSLSKPKKPNEEKGAVWERYLDNKETYDMYIDNKHLFIHQTEVSDAYKNNEVQGICCINLLATGFDYKPLSCVIINKATQSLPLHMQIIGRGERPSEGKEDCIVLDFGTNVDRLGEAEKKREWCLWHEMSDGVGLPAMKICGDKGKDKNGKKGCKRMILASYSLCPFCGFRFATEKELREVELVERLKEQPKSIKEMSALALLDYAELNGHKKTWVFRQLWLRGDYLFNKGMDMIKKMSEEDRQKHFDRLGLTSYTEPERIVDQIKKKLRKQEFQKGMTELGYKNGYIFKTLDRYEKSR